MKHTPKRSSRLEHKLAAAEAAPDALVRPRKRMRTKTHADWKVDGVRVSDHAVLRFVQIVLGVDIVAVRKTIVGDGRARIIKKTAHCKLPMGDLKLVVKNRVVVTVLKKGSRYVTQD